MKKLIFPQEVDFLFKIFSKDSLRLVGGCVRDYFLGKRINDYDFATKYKPNKVKNILEKNNIKYFTIGEKFGTITAVINEKNFEITTLRKDIKTDGRHAVVEFTDSYREDAERRDFTFNALYMDNKGQIYDFFDGQRDLANGKIKFIGKAENRIMEDNLRILRFFRFFSQCNISEFDYKDLLACVKYKYLIKNLSRERITGEFFKILSTNYSVKTLKIMQNFGILQEIFLNKLQLNNLEIFYSLKKFIDFKYNNLFIFAIIASKNDVKFNFMLTNKEKKYINTLVNYKFNKSKNFEFTIKKLLFECNDRKMAEDIVILNFCNNYDKIDDFYSLKNCLNLIRTVEIPKLEVSGKKLLEIGFENREDFSKIINEVKNIYMNSDFKLKLSEMIEIIKNK